MWKKKKESLQSGDVALLVSCWRGSGLSELREQNRIKREMRGKGATSVFLHVEARRDFDILE